MNKKKQSKVITSNTSANVVDDKTNETSETFVPAKSGKKMLLCYFYTKDNIDFWSNVVKLKSDNQEIMIINLTEQALEIEDSEIKVFNFDKKNYLVEMSELFYSKRFQADYILLLENDERPVFGADISSLNAEYNINIVPEVPEILEYDIEPFTTKERRLISLKSKDLKEFVTKGDFFYDNSKEVIDKKILYITKKDINPDFEILKASIFQKEESTFREKFIFATSYFYKNSILAEKIYLEIIEHPKGEYKQEALAMLLKLLVRKQAFERVIELSEKYKNLADNPAANTYVGLSKFETWSFIEAISYLHKAIKQKNDFFIFNNSDLNYKTLEIIGDIFYRLDRYINAEKYLELAAQKLGDFKSPKIFLLMGKIKFKQKEYDKAFEIFLEMMNIENIPTKIIKDAKYAILNLLLFVDFKEEFLQILSKDYFDKSDEILRIADTFYMNENYIEALQLYILVVDKFGVDQDLLFKLGYISSKLRSLEQACIYFEKYLEKVPDNLDALNNLAFLYLNLEKLELAEKTYKKILTLNNYSFEANLHLAIIYISQNNKKKAQEFLEKAKILNPVSPEVIKLYQIFKTELK